MFEKQDSHQADQSVVSGGERGWKRRGGLREARLVGPVARENLGLLSIE